MPAYICWSDLQGTTILKVKSIKIVIASVWPSRYSILSHLPIRLELVIPLVGEYKRSHFCSAALACSSPLARIHAIGDATSGDDNRNCPRALKSAPTFTP